MLVQTGLCRTCCFFTRRLINKDHYENLNIAMNSYFLALKFENFSAENVDVAEAVLTSSNNLCFITKLKKKTMHVPVNSRVYKIGGLWGTFSPGKHVRAIYTPLNPTFSKTGVCRSIPIFLIFAPKHRLWVLVRTASARRLLRRF